MPYHTIKVDRSTRWGNPFKVGGDASFFSVALPKAVENNFQAVECFKYYLKTKLIMFSDYCEDLRNMNLACWCKLDEYCHADVLMKVANAKSKREKLKICDNIYD